MRAEHEAVRFEAVIVPHRSLGPAGLWWVLGSLLALSAAVSAGAWYLGAWPVIGFSGTAVLVAASLLGRNVRGARAAEIILLSDSGLRVIRTDGRGGRAEAVLRPYWLRASLEERPGRAPALLLCDGGTLIEIATALGEEEKRQLAAALRDALHRQRNPVFDNPQLRE